MSTSAFRIPNACAAVTVLAICMGPGISVADDSRGTISSSLFGKTPNGIAVEHYTLRNRQGMAARIATYRGIVTHLSAPDRKGHLDDMVLGYEALAGYIKSSPNFGALIGRYGTRIAKGPFTLNGAQYKLATNNGPNAQHGGITGFDKVVWKATQAVVTVNGPQLTLTYSSPDGEEGYPGKLDVTAAYKLTDDNALRLDYNGFCMEPQHFPDSPNKTQFPSVVLKPGQTYRNTIIYRFSAR
jgi:aldose 1-epimerase